MALTYVKPEKLSLKAHPQFTEFWVRDRIKDDPSLLHLGDLEVLDMEHKLPTGGRIDLLLADQDNGRWYEVELMLGAVDESHIIRTIEYWDIERRRYPQYEHIAVLVAEDVTARFLNVISLFNNAIPIIAMQMSAWQHEGHVFLTFAKVLDVIEPGEPLTGGEGGGGSSTRKDWEKKVTAEMLTLVDDNFALLQEVHTSITPRYTKRYIGVFDDASLGNFVVFRPRKGYLHVAVAADDWEPWRIRLEDAGITLAPRPRRFHLRREQFPQNRELLKELFTAAYLKAKAE